MLPMLAGRDIVYRTIATHLIKKAGFTKETAQTGAVTLIQRLGSAPNSKHHALVTPAKRGKGNKSKVLDETEEHTPVERHAAMTWAQRLKRVFNIDPNAARSRPARNAAGKSGSSPASKIRW